jgi:hypothetical protein
MGEKMPDEGRRFYLRIALIVIGLIAIFGLYPLLILWPSGWSWGHGHSHYAMMIVGIYATLGVFLLMASRNPDAHRSLIWFTVWSSVVHGGSWRCRPLAMWRSAVISSAMSLRSSSLPSCWRY